PCAPLLRSNPGCSGLRTTSSSYRPCWRPDASTVQSGAANRRPGFAGASTAAWLVEHQPGPYLLTDARTEGLRIVCESRVGCKVGEHREDSVPGVGDRGLHTAIAARGRDLDTHTHPGILSQGAGNS